ncbi:23S rRNA (uracil(747)-C(5))-methyltransferase RlmC [Permianibacter sp. IMCC34836]|nr:23S rRNA (uracil(747)-C(5))-methyltransferase RlmC [Permianibacter fluminis]
MACADYQSARCRSCGWLELPYPEQLQRKDAELRQLLASQVGEQTDWLPAVASPLAQFRNRAKMVISGTAADPVLGIIDEQGSGVDLQACPLYPQPLRPVFTALIDFIRLANLEPYRISERRGELKYLLINRSHADGGIMLRFVLRSRACLDIIRKHLPVLRAQLPQLKVASVNLQPLHMAVLEGDQEIMLTEQQELYDQLNDVPLYLRPKSFFQTNPAVAAQLYARVRQWARELPLKSVWDLFCGVGGFGLHCVDKDIALTGIEREAEAIACAERSAREMGLTQVRFAALDAAGFVDGEASAPDLVLVNPPRRGIGPDICRWLQATAPQHLIYSSCNAESLARDLALLPNYQLQRVQLFDMFPHTSHYETLVQLRLAKR